MQNKKRRKVCPQDFSDKMEVLLCAAEEGRLFIEEKETGIPSRSQIIEDVRAYVSQIRYCATRQYCDVIDEVWEEIFNHEEFVKMLLPGPKTRRCREFNKYGVMRIIGVLRSFSVYDERYNDTNICQALEHRQNDCSYRCYIGMGFDTRTYLCLMKEILAKINL